MGGFLKWFVTQQPLVFLLKMIILGWRLGGVPPFKAIWPYVPISVLAELLLVIFKPSGARSCWLHERPFWFLAPALTRRSHLFWGRCCSMALVGGSPRGSEVLASRCWYFDVLSLVWFNLWSHNMLLMLSLSISNLCTYESECCCVYRFSHWYPFRLPFVVPLRSLWTHGQIWSGKIGRVGEPSLIVVSIHFLGIRITHSGNST